VCIVVKESWNSWKYLCLASYGHGFVDIRKLKLRSRPQHACRHSLYEVTSLLLDHRLCHLTISVCHQVAAQQMLRQAIQRIVAYSQGPIIISWFLCEYATAKDTGACERFMSVPLQCLNKTLLYCDNLPTNCTCPPFPRSCFCGPSFSVHPMWHPVPPQVTRHSCCPASSLVELQGRWYGHLKGNLASTNFMSVFLHYFLTTGKEENFLYVLSLKQNIT